MKILSTALLITFINYKIFKKHYEKHEYFALLIFNKLFVIKNQKLKCNFLKKKHLHYLFIVSIPTCTHSFFQCTVLF